MKVTVKVNEVKIPAAGSVDSIEFSAEYTVEEFTKMVDTMPAMYEKLIAAVTTMQK